MSNYPDDFKGLPGENLTDQQERAGQRLTTLESSIDEAVNGAFFYIIGTLKKYEFYPEIGGDDNLLLGIISEAVEDYIYDFKCKLMEEAGE